MTHQQDIYIGLGSNLANPEQQLQSAIIELRTHQQLHDIKVSNFYRSPALGGPQQPDFVNAVARLNTNLPPLELLDLLQGIENKQGRRRTIHWGPRTLDLDLLLYGDQIIHSKRLTVPHPEIQNRSFVLIPLYELDAKLHIPNLGPVEILIQQLGPTKLEKINAQ